MTTQRTASKISLLLLALTGSAFNFTGCTDSEVANAIGAGAIVAGAVIIGANSECVGDYQTLCTRSYDYYGREYNECRRVYNECAYTRPRTRMNVIHSINGDEDTTAAVKKRTINSAVFAKEFNLSFHAASTFLRSMRNAESGDIQALRNIGITEADARLLAEKKMITESGLQTMASHLNTHVSIVKVMIERLIEASH